MMHRRMPRLGIVLPFLFLVGGVVNAGIRAAASTRDAMQTRKLEIEEYPVQIEPFHIVYHYNPNRDQNFDGMEEMDVLAATRAYLTNVLSREPDNEFKRLLLYLFIREQDGNMTKVAYSGTVFFAMPTSPSMRLHVQQSSWYSFLGSNKTEYLSKLSQYGIEDIDSITLMNAGGNVVGVDTLTGTLTTIVDDADIVTVSVNGPPDTDMSSSVSMTIYLCAITIPIAVLFIIIFWWLVRKLQYDVEWKQSDEMDPEGPIWQSAQRLEQVMVRPITPGTFSGTESFATGLTRHSGLPTNIVVVPEDESGDSYRRDTSLRKEGETNLKRPPPLLSPPTNIVISDTPSASTRGSSVTRKYRSAHSPKATNTEKAYKPIETKSQFVVSKPRNPVEKSSASAELSNNDKTTEENIQVQKTTKRKAEGDSKSRAKPTSRSPMKQSNHSESAASKTSSAECALKVKKKPKSESIARKEARADSKAQLNNKSSPSNSGPITKTKRSITSDPQLKPKGKSAASLDTQSGTKVKERVRRETNRTPVQSTGAELRRGLPPTPKKKLPCSSAAEAEKRKTMDPNAAKRITPGVVDKEGAVLKPAKTARKTASDPPGAKVATVNRKRSSNRSVIANQKADASGAKSEHPKSNGEQAASIVQRETASATATRTTTQDPSEQNS